MTDLLTKSPIPLLHLSSLSISRPHSSISHSSKFIDCGVFNLRSTQAYAKGNWVEKFQSVVAKDNEAI